MLDPLALLQEFVAVPAPPGQEGELAALVIAKLKALGYEGETDAKGNVLVQIGEGKPEIVVTAHLDELAAMVKRVGEDGRLDVTPLGGVQPWKWGEGQVELFAKETVPGILSFGSIHTEDPAAVSVQAKGGEIGWKQTKVFTGLNPVELKDKGVRPGTRVVIARNRRNLARVGDFVSGYFLDDRADLVAWFLMLEALKGQTLGQSVLFVATVSEEVGGEGALYLFNEIRPAICIALELGPIVPDTPAVLSAVPTVWAKDSYAAMDSRDLDLIAGLAHEVQWQVLSRGGSDASCAASHGLCARPVTFGIPMENSHGYEIVHKDGMRALADVALAYLKAIL